MDAALALVDYLAQVPPTERLTRFQEVRDCTTVLMSPWFLGLFSGATADNIDDLARIAEVMPDADIECAFWYRSGLALAVALAEREQQAVAQVRSNLERYPGDTWTRIHSAFVYDVLDRTQDAIDLYTDAMRDATDEGLWQNAEEQLRSLLERVGRGEEHDRIVRRFPRPSCRAWSKGDSQRVLHHRVGGCQSPANSPPRHG